MTWAPTAVLDCWRENLMHLRWNEMILGWLLEELSSQEVHHTTSVVNFIPDKFNLRWEIVQFSSAAHSCLTLCDLMDRSTPGFPVHHQLLEFTQTHVHQIGDAIQPSHPLLSLSLPAFNLSQHQGLFKWVCALHQVAKVLEFQLQYQSFQRIFRTNFL